MPGLIEDYALVGDMQTAALICRDGSVDWLCIPRFDSPACFAAMLGDERHGHWRIAPAGAPSATQGGREAVTTGQHSERGLGGQPAGAGRPGDTGGRQDSAAENGHGGPQDSAGSGHGGPQDSAGSGGAQGASRDNGQSGPRDRSPGDSGHGSRGTGTQHHNAARGGDGPARTGPVTARRRYRADTLILETEWETPTGVARVIDFMPPRDGGQPTIMRIVEGVYGTVDMEVTLRVRPDYGRIVPWMRRLDNKLLAIAGPDAISLRTPVRLTGQAYTHRGTFSIEPGQQVPFVLTWGPSHAQPSEPLDVGTALKETERFWAEWVATCSYDGEYRDAVIRSLITLKALTYHPTGGIVAAATTSLPEDLGGERNWDYRYCWLRDATITLEALLRAGYVEEARAWRAWLERAVAGDPHDVQIMYGVAGERRLTEWHAEWLPGYAASAPVRIGNAAAEQFQLDVYGEVLDALDVARRAGMEPDRHAWSLQRGLVNFVEQHWQQPDEGLWEVRGPRRHFVHSKVMAWVAFDRAAKAAKAGLPGSASHWAGLARRVHGDVCSKGFSAERGAFTQYYGSTQLDAALLIIPEVGFLPPDDPRVTKTVEAIKERLLVDGFVRRYELEETGESGVDGLAGSEGAFLACSFWLADALHMTGHTDEALELFERLLALRNDVGLLSEEYDPRYGRHVGNTPQAFSHVPLVRTAFNLSDHARHHGRRVRSGR